MPSRAEEITTVRVALYLARRGDCHPDDVLRAGQRFASAPQILRSIEALIDARLVHRETPMFATSDAGERLHWRGPRVTP